MEHFNKFKDYFELSEILFDAEKKPEQSLSRIRCFSVSSSTESINSDNSNNVDTANTSSALYQWNQSLEPLPEISTALPTATTSPLVPPRDGFNVSDHLSLHAGDDLSLHVGDDLFTQDNFECPLLSPVDDARVMAPTPVGRAIAGRNVTGPGSISTQQEDTRELDVDVCVLFNSTHRNNRSSNVDLSQLVHGVVRKAYGLEMISSANRFYNVCVFCQRNGETKEFCSTHVLKDSKGRVVCPVLRNYVCPSCNATGDNAHTLRHCPFAKNVASMSDTFKTRRTSCGFRKFNC